jgi:hypothetical protein
MNSQCPTCKETISADELNAFSHCRRIYHCQCFSEYVASIELAHSIPMLQAVCEENGWTWVIGYDDEFSRHYFHVYRGSMQVATGIGSLPVFISSLVDSKTDSQERGIERLLSAYCTAVFKCGEWREGASESYEDVYNRKQEAERALESAIKQVERELALSKQHNKSWSKDFDSLAKKLDAAEAKLAARQVEHG